MSRYQTIRMQTCRDKRVPVMFLDLFCDIPRFFVPSQLFFPLFNVLIFGDDLLKCVVCTKEGWEANQLLVFRLRLHVGVCQSQRFNWHTKYNWHTRLTIRLNLGPSWRSERLNLGLSWIWFLNLPGRAEPVFGSHGLKSFHDQNGVYFCAPFT